MGPWTHWAGKTGDMKIAGRTGHQTGDSRACAGPRADGLPTTHSRLKIIRRVGGPRRDGRSCDLAEVKRLIWKGFGWSRPTEDETKAV